MPLSARGACRRRRRRRRGSPSAVTSTSTRLKDDAPNVARLEEMEISEPRRSALSTAGRGHYLAPA